jgi:hypothetical protein
MPDNTYTWVTMVGHDPVPHAVHQKKYSLRSWLRGHEDDIDEFTIYRFPPYGQESTIVNAKDILNGK